MLVTQRAGVIPKQPRAAGATGQADLLLDLLLRRQGLATALVVAD